MATDLDSISKSTLATIAVGCLLSVALALALPKWVPALAPHASVSVASFDIVKYTNAQRAVASAFLRPNTDAAKTNELLLGLPERTREAIEDAAGPGTLVVLKQAVIQGQTLDITDDVLTRLGLPTNVPTADAAAYVLDHSPALWGIPSANDTPTRSAQPAPQREGLKLP